MCNEDEGSVTIKPCGHVYCQGMLKKVYKFRYISQSFYRMLQEDKSVL